MIKRARPPLEDCYTVTKLPRDMQHFVYAHPNLCKAYQRCRNLILDKLVDWSHRNLILDKINVMVRMLVWVYRALVLSILG
jgi:hypothetical protein